MSILNCLPCKNEQFFPNGYKFKTGSISHTVCNANPNMIPLTIRLNDLVAGGEGGESLYVGGRLIYKNNQSNHRVTAMLDIMFVYGYDFVQLIANNQIVKYNTIAGTIEVVAWLEKSVGVI